MKTFKIEQRDRLLVPTAGSQRRCYDGCFHPSDWEYSWSAWEWLSLNVPEDEVEEKLKFWRDLTEYSLSVGGKTVTEYRAVEEECA